MLPVLARRLDRLDSRRAALLARIAPLTPEQLGYRPSAERWHVLDVVEHLVIIEELVLRALGTRPGPLPWAERLRAGLRLGALRLFLRAGGRVRAPSRAIFPRGSVTLAELRERWDRTRAGYRTALEAFDRSDLARPMMKHPIIGKLTPTQALTFLDAHLAHHARQIDRLQRTFSQASQPPSNR